MLYLSVPSGHSHIIEYSYSSCYSHFSAIWHSNME